MVKSIDIFDTAILRDVYEPKDIFKLIEKEVGNNFYIKRLEAEEKVRKVHKYYTIQQIYKYLPGFDYNKEIEMEFNHTYPNAEILNMYNQNPIDYIFISDMYLSSETLKALLEKRGFLNPKVFVSCEQKANKGSGKLFTLVEKKLNCKITEHYGDNYLSDIVSARRLDIEPIFKPALHKMNLNLPAVKNPLLKKYAAALEVSEERPLTKLAKWYAPLIYEFTKWVISQQKPGQHVYFLSRDMFMPYLIALNFLKAKNVHYLYCSRRSLAPLFLASREKPLLDKMKIVLSDEEYKQKKKKGTKDCLEYLRSTGIKNGDILVDIGYSGSTQRILEKFLKIKLQGLYIQLDQVPLIHNVMDMKMFLDRYALIYRFLAEFIMTSPENNIEDYYNCKPVTSPDNEQRIIYAKHVNSIILNERLFRRIDRMNIDLFDIEQMLIHVQTYPSMEMMKLFNQPILTNRQQMERGINFNRSSIMRGRLLPCYRKSYAKPLFKKMLLADPELCGLIDLLPN